MCGHSEVPLTWHSLSVCSGKELVRMLDEPLPSSIEGRLAPAVLYASVSTFISPSSECEACVLVVQWLCCGSSGGN